jgi:hypothetical protein
MFCTRCGTPNAAEAIRCGRCGEPMQALTPAPPGAPVQYISNYLAQAILTTIFCCVPFGIVAIIYAAQVNGKVLAGDYAGAINYSRNARLWCWLSFGIGLLFTIFWIALQVVMYLARTHSSFLRVFHHAATSI